MVSQTMFGQVYWLFFCRSSTFALTIAVGILFFERAFDQGGDVVYDSINHRKFLKHIKHKYEEE
ncbi:cytochrome b-c1 complex subunit 9-like [Dromiciops gliroides]|uniref:cytochrome b-c1 complex subunit 9-like n=1 Tax=Dromiciops gliroides TaxID=33562 RepID=UPI001CC49253|nr:cytochrome b-c1 complex subunit 9-like [Dromiciops gliroides]